MAKKKSCQNVRNPRVLSPAERELYGWVDAEVFTQSSVLAPEDLPEFRREVGLARDLASEGDFVLEAAGPSDRWPFQALEGEAPFLWVYAELFTRLGVRFPLSDFQREVLTRCQVAAASVPAPAVPAVPNPPPTAADKGRSSKDPVGKPFPVQGEEGGKEDPSADLKRKGRKRKTPGTAAEEAALGADAAWVHGVSPVERAFPESYNFRGALDAGLTNNATREILGPLVPEQLLGTAQHLACQLTACLQ
ncbi:hypothetical protein PIB30_060409, partial [Stylosanthes scabra]|nr:hypothetical protein [Stylosanthes scabra]